MCLLPWFHGLQSFMRSDVRNHLFSQQQREQWREWHGYVCHSRLSALCHLIKKRNADMIRHVSQHMLQGQVQNSLKDYTIIYPANCAHLQIPWALSNVFTCTLFRHINLSFSAPPSAPLAFLFFCCLG